MMPLDQPPQSSQFAPTEVFQNFKGPSSISFFADGSKLIVSISTSDGKVTFGPGVTPDEAAKRFWEQVTKFYPSICQSK